MTELKARPKRQRRKEFRPDEIIEAGMIEFASKGYAGTRLSRVAERAGVSKGTIYHYFKNKDELFRQVFRTKFIDSLSQIEQFPTLPEGSIAPFLRMALRHAYAKLAESEALGILKIMVVEGERFPELISACRDDLMEKVSDQFRALIQRGIDQGEFEDGAYKDLPEILFAPGVIIALATETFNGDKTQSKDVFDAAQEVLLKGVLKR